MYLAAVCTLHASRYPDPFRSAAAPPAQGAVPQEGLDKSDGLRGAQLNEEFRLNPHQLAANIITDKPNIDPKVYGLHVDADPETVAELGNILKETKKAPTEKYDAPLTTSQEIGWHSVPLMPGRKRFGTKQCEITAYADAYSSAMGKNPFARKDPIVSNH